MNWNFINDIGGFSEGNPRVFQADCAGYLKLHRQVFSSKAFGKIQTDNDHNQSSQRLQLCLFR